MKKALIFAAPAVSYLMAYGITKLEEQMLYMPDMITQFFILKCIFFVLLGGLLSLFSRRIAAEIENHVIHIICIAVIILPVLLWLYDTSHDPAGTLDYYFLVYFLYLGGYGAAFHAIFRNKNQNKKSDIIRG